MLSVEAEEDLRQEIGFAKDVPDVETICLAPNWCAMSVDRSCSVSTSFWLLGTERGGKIFESSG